MVIDMFVFVVMFSDELDVEWFEVVVEVDYIWLMLMVFYLEMVFVIEVCFGELGGCELDLWFYCVVVDFVVVYVD